MSIIILTMVLHVGFAQSSTDAPISRLNTFRIGYIRQDPEAVTTSGVYQRLREFLMAQPDVRSAMEAAGINAIMAQSFESHRLLIEAMDAEQLDLAFCSALDFAYQRGNYEPVFQLRRPGDPHSSAGDRRVWHSGVIFVNNRSPLFNMETSAALAALPSYVMDHEMAMVGSSSAAGYVYPYLALDRLTTSIPVMNASSVFWDSSSEVIKAVINGIHDIGACDSSAIDEVLKAHGLLANKDKLIKEILRSDPVPRDPIVVRSKWLSISPYSATSDSALGREITRALAGFFRVNPGLPSLERTTREPFTEVAENLERFRQKRRQAESTLPEP